MTVSPALPLDDTIRSVKQRIDRPLVLVGMMGVGKSTIGRKLAHALSMSFTDADDEVEAAANMTIREVFEQFGEEHFRDGERRVIARLMEEARAGSVIATGGGAFVQPQTRDLILQNGIAIWLDAQIDTLVERVGRNDRRPLLSDGDPRTVVTKMKSDREAAYASAPIRVESDHGPHHVAVRRIVEALDQWLT